MDTPVVFVCSEKDFPKLERNIPQYKACISGAVTVIGKASLRQPCQRAGLAFIDEDALYPSLTYKAVEHILRMRAGDVSRTGWYFQQFLKMAFAFTCTEPYYLLWDADTIPLHRYEATARPVFDTKTEHHQAYFDTIQRLFPELRKEHDYSYISEHMLINSKIMREIVEQIEALQSVEGTSFFEKILYSVEPEELGKSGFSEYETYGTYTAHYYPQLYGQRDWTSLREENDWCNADVLSPRLKGWLAQRFDAVSFDSWRAVNRHKQKFMLRLSYFYGHDDALRLYVLYVRDRMEFLRQVGAKRFLKIGLFPWLLKE